MRDLKQAPRPNPRQPHATFALFLLAAISGAAISFADEAPSGDSEAELAKKLKTLWRTSSACPSTTIGTSVSAARTP